MERDRHSIEMHALAVTVYFFPRLTTVRAFESLEGLTHLVDSSHHGVVVGLMAQCRVAGT